MQRLLLLVAFFASSSHGFAPSASVLTAQKTMPRTVANIKISDNQNQEVNSFDPFSLANANEMNLVAPSATADRSSSSIGAAVATSAILWACTSNSASAAGPDWGIFEGRTGSLLHPIMMGSLFLYTLYTAFLGFQWRRQREIGTQLSGLKKQLPKFSESTLQEAISAAEQAEDTALVVKLQAAQPIQKEVDELDKERKELASQGNRDKHWSQGSLIAFLGTLFAIEGPLNTYARAGKLFPGPHLYAGAGLVVCWAAAVAMVPSMQKGSDTARSLHIAANVIGMALFAWQVQSGLPILFKVIELTKWP